MRSTLHKGLLAMSSLAVLLALGACGQREDAASTAARQETREAAADAGAAARDAGTAVMGAAGDAATTVERKLDDAEIVTKVNAGLAADKDLSALAIDVDSKDGIVTLSGTAPTSAAKERAETIAKNVKDVKTVNNQLQVKAG